MQNKSLVITWLQILKSHSNVIWSEKYSTVPYHKETLESRQIASPWKLANLEIFGIPKSCVILSLRQQHFPTSKFPSNFNQYLLSSQHPFYLVKSTSIATRKLLCPFPLLAGDRAIRLVASFFVVFEALQMVEVEAIQDASALWYCLLISCSEFFPWG